MTQEDVTDIEALLRPYWARLTRWALAAAFTSVGAAFALGWSLHDAQARVTALEQKVGALTHMRDDLRDMARDLAWIKQRMGSAP